MGEGVNLKVNDCLSAASCYERLKLIPEPKSLTRGTLLRVFALLRTHLLELRADG
ncbi:hypothetical protein QWZ13_04920 [Reinekea marina]|uniref:hypothetical protein n=1 Tax=Reinekea marina TaxID=1310421 RepID=UPI0025B38208|nr:hypothetical protein [Reinekea marina]MDN3648249.1 hypothetical protein [Reinekea marina]